MEQPSVRKLPRRYKSFIRGPIPDGWVQEAGLVSPMAVVIGIILWRIAHKDGLWGFNNLKRRSGAIPLTNHMCRKCGIKRSSKMNVLRAMEEAGLVRFHIPKKKNVEVMIIDDYIINTISPSGYSQPF